MSSAKARDLFKQIAPLVVLLLIPTLVLTVSKYTATLLRSPSMVLETLSLILPWNWYSSHSGTGSSQERRKLKKKIVRTRTEQLGINSDAAGSSKDIRYDNEGQYPGIVNISGTYCFMDSTLQAMASLAYLQPYIEEVHARAEDLDVPTPVVDALRNILHQLNTPKSSPRPLRPVEIIHALANHSKGKHSALFSSREHQDAQELFQLVSEAVKSESIAVYKEGLRDRGLGGLAQKPGNANIDINKGVFDGLTANRRSCLQCGYTEAVMHFAFDNWQLAVPRQSACRLEDCLDDYTRIEVLTDCICRKCSMVATYERLEQEAEKLTQATSPDSDPSSSKRRRARDARKLATKVKTALAEGRIEEDIKGVKLDKVTSMGSTKQAMIARPPRVLALHLNRSLHFGHYAAKNTCRVHFPEILDLTTFTTSGMLSTSPSSPISVPSPPLSLTRSTTPTPATYSSPRTLYRLSAVVCHYGQHSFGHYVCFRRRPRPPSSGTRRYAPPKLQCPFGCDCEKCERSGSIREDDGDPPNPSFGSGRGWLRISDDAVQECGIESVMQEGSGAFMLYYERIVQEGVYGSHSPRCSEETLKPCETAGPNASRASLVEGAKGEDENASALGIMSSSSRRIGARIVRNVSAQRARSTSTPTRANLSDSVPTHSFTEIVNAGKLALNGDAHGYRSSHPLDTKNVSSTQYPHPTSPTPATRTPQSSTRPNAHATGTKSADTGLKPQESPVRPSSHSQPHSPSRSLSSSQPPRHEQEKDAHQHQQSKLQLQSPPLLDSPAPAHVRVKAPQPVYTETARPLSPPRIVGLRA